MKVKKLFIKNFRSVGNDGIEIDLVSNLTAIIGKNNVGKSNLLRAIHLLLGPNWPREDAFSLEDFYQKNINNDIEITAYFDTPHIDKIKIDGWYEYEAKVHGIKLEYKTYKRDCPGGKKGELHLELNCISATGKPVMVPSQSPKKGGGALKFDTPLPFKRTIKEGCISTVLVPNEREIIRNSPSSSRSLLGSMFKKISEEFLESKEEMTIAEEHASILGISKNITRRQLFEAYLKKANDALRTPDFDKVSKTIHKYLSEHLGEHQTEGMAFDFKLLDSWDQYKNMLLSVEHDSLSLPATKLGHGFQSLIVVAIFRSFVEIENKKCIFLIEEPEMFLHPHAKKYFYSVLKNIAKENVQVVYTTHSTEFVDILNYKNIRRLVWENQATAIYPKSELELDFKEDEILKLNTAVNNERGELYFAEKVLLVEGETEKVIYDYLLKQNGTDPNLFNISIIEASGKGAMPRYIKLLQGLSIDFVAVYDSDILTKTGDAEKDQKIEENNIDAKGKNERILAAAEKMDRLFVMSPYFEFEAGMNEDKSKKRESKPLAALKYFESIGSLRKIQEQFPKILAPIDGILNTLAPQKQTPLATTAART